MVGGQPRAESGCFFGRSSTCGRHAIPREMRGPKVVIVQIELRDTGGYRSICERRSDEIQSGTEFHGEFPAADVSPHQVTGLYV